MGQPLRRLLLRGNEFAVAAGFYKADQDVGQDAAERILDWIMAHSFGDLDVGYSYIDPLDAGGRTWGRRGRGLPQGPPLSAYLGTIALFDLDKRMVQEVEYLNQRCQEAQGGSPQGKRRCAAVYARYVDDIILVATSEVDLRHLLNCATEELTNAGLRGNDKSEVMIPKTILEAREWLVEHRGAGFGYGSSSVEDMPAPLLSSTILDTESLRLDRRQLLAITLDPKLDDPSISSQFVIKRLEQVAQAAKELRESDFGFLARRMLMRLSLDVAAEPSGAENNSQGPGRDDDRLREFAIKIVDTWLKKLWPERGMFQPDGEDGLAEQQANEALQNSGGLIALFDGVERLLASRPEQNPAYEDNARKDLANARDHFINAVRHGLLRLVRTVCDERLGAERSTLWAQLTQTQIILEERADIIWQQKNHKVGGKDPARMGRAKLQMPDTSGSPSPAFWRLLSSWYCRFQLKPEGENIYPGIEAARDQLVAVLKYSGDGDWTKEVPFAALHMTISLLEALRIVPGRQQNDVNIRRELRALLSDDSLPPKFGDAPEGTSITLVLKMWFGGTGDLADSNSDIQNRAAITFFMIVSNSQALSELLPHRPDIVNALANDTNAQLLPPPPAPGSARLIIKTNDRLRGLVLLTNEQEEQQAPGFYPDFTWHREEETNPSASKIHRYIADLDGFKPLLLANGLPDESVGEKDVPTIVSSLLMGAIKDHKGDSYMPPLVTPYSIFFRIFRIVSLFAGIQTLQSKRARMRQGC